MLTPLYFSRTLAAGARDSICAYGRHIFVASVSASTINLGIGDDPPQQVLARERIDCGDRQYSRIVLQNAGLVPSTVVLILSETLVELNDQDAAAQLVAIHGHVESIDQEISGAAAAAVAGQLADTVCAITPGPGTAIFAANATRTEIEISAPTTNGAGLIYLGITAARATAVDKFIVLSAGESWWSDREKGAIFACSSTGAEIVNGREC